MNWQIQQWMNKKLGLLTNDRARLVLILGLAIGVFSLGFLVGHHRLQNNLAILAKGRDSVVADQLVVIVTKPDLVLGQLRFLVKPVGEQYYLAVTSNQEIKTNPGDRVKISGLVKKEKENNLKDQSFNQYELSQMIAGQVSLNKLEMVKLASPFSFRRIIFNIQNYLYALADHLWPYPHNILTLGVLVGRNDFSADWKQIFRVAGLSHIVVLSGYNLSIVVNALYSFYLDRLRYIKAGLGLLVAVLLAAVSGFGASSLRALVMVSVAIYAKLSGRTYLAFRALIFTVIVLSLWWPLMFLYDVGFQLSVLATFGLIWLAEPLANCLAVKRWPGWFCELVGGTLAAEIMVLPLLSLKFGQVATYGLFANVLVLPAVPLLMILSFATLILASFSLIIAYPLSLVTYLTSIYIITVAKLFNWLPFSALPITLTWPWVFCWYGVLLGYLIYKHQQEISFN